MDATNGSCILCNKDLQNGIPAVQLRERGCDGINKASTERETDIVTVPGQYVHVQCRRDYCNPNTIKRDRKTTT